MWVAMLLTRRKYNDNGFLGQCLLGLFMRSDDMMCIEEEVINWHNVALPICTEVQYESCYSTFSYNKQACNRWNYIIEVFLIILNFLCAKIIRGRLEYNLIKILYFVCICICGMLYVDLVCIFIKL